MAKNIIQPQVKRSRPNEKFERNTFIYNLRKAGRTLEEIGLLPEINLTRQRVQKIFSQYQRKLDRLAGDIQ